MRVCVSGREGAAHAGAAFLFLHIVSSAAFSPWQRLLKNSLPLQLGLIAVRVEEEESFEVAAAAAAFTYLWPACLAIE